jgi:hypothetical protein
VSRPPVASTFELPTWAHPLVAPFSNDRLKFKHLFETRVGLKGGDFVISPTAQRAFAAFLTVFRARLCAPGVVLPFDPSKPQWPF